ncbi:hypothetical protein BD779DRAFT_1520536 [Infundibulicybe gibba]|nr:hypothetical protein BD779DRAFT_1520536 [Infundibulicybe gibba]
MDGTVGQAPPFFYLGCTDSRLSEGTLSSADPGIWRCERVNLGLEARCHMHMNWFIHVDIPCSHTALLYWALPMLVIVDVGISVPRYPHHRAPRSVLSPTGSSLSLKSLKHPRGTWIVLGVRGNVEA